jgi:hypothetical protein
MTNSQRLVTTTLRSELNLLRFMLCVVGGRQHTHWADLTCFLAEIMGAPAWVDGDVVTSQVRTIKAASNRRSNADISSDVGRTAGTPLRLDRV